MLFEQFLNSAQIRALGFGDYSTASRPGDGIVRAFESRLDQFRANLAGQDLRRHAAGGRSRAFTASPLGMDMQIRRFQPADEAAVIALWHRCDLVVPRNDPARDIALKMAWQPELFLVGEEDDRIVATVMAGYEGHRGWINYLAVDPDVRRHGLGRMMMSAAEEALRALGCPKINLQVRASNEAGRGLLPSHRLRGRRGHQLRQTPVNAPAAPTARPLRVAYFVMRHPLLTQTFLDREMRGLMGHGLEVEVHPIWDWRNRETPQARRSAHCATRLSFDHVFARCSRRWPIRAWSGGACARLSGIGPDSPRDGSCRSGAGFSRSAPPPIFAHAPRAVTAWRGCMARGRPPRPRRRLRSRACSACRSALARTPTIFTVTAAIRCCRSSCSARASSTPRRRRTWIPSSRAFPIAPRKSCSRGAGCPICPPLTDEKRDAVINPQDIRLLSVGRLVEKKGHSHQLAAVAELRRRGVPARLRIIGEGPARTNARGSNSRAGIDRMCRLGWRAGARGRAAGL